MTIVEAAQPPVSIPADSPVVHDEEIVVEEEGRVEMREILESKPLSMTEEHPLESKWTLWFDNNSKRKPKSTDWADNVQQLITVGTVEEFWGVYNNVVPATSIPLGSNYHLFREGVRPAWEDEANKQGGKWTISADPKEVDPAWLFTMLACIGEVFEHSEEVTGCVFSARRQAFRIAIWTRHAKEADKTRSIGRQLREILSLKPGTSISYQLHGADRDSQPLYEA